MSKSVVDVGGNTLPHGICEKGVILFKVSLTTVISTIDKARFSSNIKIIEEDVYCQKLEVKLYCMQEGTLEWNNVNRTQDKKPSNQQQEMNTGQD